MQTIGSRVSRRTLKYSWLAALVPIGAVSALLIAQSPAGAAVAPVGLGTATSFAVLAGSAVTNTGPTILNGDLGVSPGTAITGFPPGIVNGTIYDDDGVAAGAQSDLTTAYNDAAGRTPAASLGGFIGAGQTLLPGVYKASSSLDVGGSLVLERTAIRVRCHLPGWLHPGHRLIEPRDPGRWGASLQRVLASRQFSHAGDWVHLRRHDPRLDIDHGDNWRYGPGPGAGPQWCGDSR